MVVQHQLKSIWAVMYGLRFNMPHYAIIAKKSPAGVGHKERKSDRKNERARKKETEVKRREN